MSIDHTLPTRPVSGSETLLRNKFAESIVGQSELMDKLAQQLITLELAIPGIYVAVLKLTAGDDATSEAVARRQMPTVMRRRHWVMVARSPDRATPLIRHPLRGVPRRDALPHVCADLCRPAAVG